MANFASRAKHNWDARSLQRPQPGRLGLALHNDRPALRKTGTFTLSILLWTTAQHCMFPATARGTTRLQQKIPFLSSPSGAHENLFTPAAIQGENNDHIKEVPSETNRRSSVLAFFGWGLRSNGSNALSPGKRLDEKTSVLTPSASVEASNIEDGLAEFERPSRKTIALSGQKEGFEAEEDEVSLPLEGRKQIESEEVPLETAAIPDDTAEAERRATSTGLGKRMLHRTNKMGTKSNILLPQVNSGELPDRKGSTEYNKDSKSGVPIGNFSTAPEVKHSTEHMSFTSSYKDSRHIARARHLLVGHRRVEGPQSTSRATAERSAREDCQDADFGPGRPSTPGDDVVTGENMSSGKKRNRLLGKKAEEELRVGPVLTERIKTSVSLDQAGDRTLGSQGHTKGVDETQGKPARRLAGDIDETTYGYIPSEEYMSVEGHMPGAAFTAGEGLGHAPHFQYPLWYHDSEDYNLRRESKSHSTDDVSDWMDASSLEPGFHYPSLHRFADPERHNDMRRLQDDIAEAISEYVPSEENLGIEEDATADEFTTTGYSGHEASFEYNPSQGSSNYFDLNKRLQESEANGYMVNWEDHVSPGWGVPFASGYSSLDGDFDEVRGGVGGEANLFAGASETHPYAAESFPHVQHFGAHREHFSEEDSSDFESAAPVPWPSPSNYYANASSEVFDHLDTPRPSWSSPYKYSAENSSGPFDHLNTPTSSWSSPYKYYADYPSGHFDLLDTPTPSWSSPYEDYADNPSGHFDLLNTPTPSWSSPYEGYADNPSGHFDHLDTPMPSSPYNDYAYNPSGLFEPLDKQAPSPFDPSSMHYDSHFWNGGYDDNTKNSFGDDFMPTMIDYSDWSSPAESFYPSMMASDDTDYFQDLTPGFYVE